MDRDRVGGQKVMVLASPEFSEAPDLLEEAREVFKKAISAPLERAGEEGQEANAKLKEVTNRLLALRNDAEKVSRGTNPRARTSVPASRRVCGVG